MAEFGFDEWIDAQLRNVKLPPKFLKRLAEAGTRAGPDDAQLDAELRNVPVPSTLAARLRRIPRRRRNPPMWQQVALAASLFLMIGLGVVGYLAVISGVLDPVSTQVAHQPAPAPLGNAPTPQVAPPETVDPATSLVADQRGSSKESPTIEKLDLDPITPVEPLQSKVAQSAQKPTPAPEQPGQSALGAHGTLVRLPDLDVFDGQARRGVEPPLVRGYDLLFQLRNNEHPYVSPAVHQDLETTRLPFAFATESFDEALRAVRSGRFPAKDEIRVEDFLAAQHYALPEAPPGGLALHVAGSEFPLSIGDAVPRDGSLHLLQLALQASTFDSQQHHANWLIVAIDASSQMQSQARFTGVRRALAKLARHMQDADRVTLVRFATESFIVAEKITADELAQLAWSDDLGAPSGSANLPVGIEAAWKIARDTTTLDPRHVVVISGDRGNLDPSVLPAATEKLGELASMNIPWRIVRVAADENDVHWNKLAEDARGKILAAAAPDYLYEALFGALINFTTTVAEDVSVTLKFSPQQVAAYRLVGHEATTLTGFAPQEVTVDLGADQTAVGLYEVALKPGTAKAIGTIEVTWIHPPNRQKARIVRSILREELSGGFLDAPAWLQQGAIAAKAAECLRGSHYAPKSRTFRQILELAGKVDPSVAGEADFRRIVELLEKAEKLR